MTGKEKRRAALKAGILDTAIQAFAEKGYRQTSLRYIADQLQYSPGTIYHHFANKESLFFEAQAYGFRKLKTYLEAVEAKNPFDQIQNLGEAYFRFSREWSNLYELMFLLSESSDHQTEAKPFRDALEAFAPLERASQKLWPSHIGAPFWSAEGLATFLWSNIHGVAMLYANQKYRLLGIPAAELQARNMIKQQVLLLQLAPP